MDDCPKCFGRPRDDAECSRCQWHGSCVVFSTLPSPEPRRLSGHVSYEALTRGEGLEAVDSGISDDGEDGGRPVFSVDDMAVMVRLLLSLDDYELQIMENVVHGRFCSLSELSRVFGVSKQAMHRKLSDSCFRHPQLASLLGVHLRRCRRVLQCRKARPNQRNVRDERQMEFDFA